MRSAPERGPSGRIHHEKVFHRHLARGPDRRAYAGCGRGYRSVRGCTTWCRGSAQCAGHPRQHGQLGCGVRQRNGRAVESPGHSPARAVPGRFDDVRRNRCRQLERGWRLCPGSGQAVGQRQPDPVRGADRQPGQECRPIRAWQSRNDDGRSLFLFFRPGASFGKQQGQDGLSRQQFGQLPIQRGLCVEW